MKMRTAMAAFSLAAIAATTACTSGSNPCVSEFGAWGDEMPDLEMMVGDTARSDLADHFGPRDCMETPWTASWSLWELRSSDPAAVAVLVSAEHILETAALGVADSVRVRVALTVFESPDEEFHEFTVRVRAP